MGADDKNTYIGKIIRRILGNKAKVERWKGKGYPTINRWA